MQAELAAPGAHVVLVACDHRRQARIGESLAFERTQPGEIQTLETLLAQQLLLAQQIFDLREEPGIDLRGIENLFERPAGAEGVRDIEDAGGPGPAQLVRELVGRFLVQRQRELFVESVVAELETAQRLLHRFLERPADRHRLADRFHLRGQAGVRAGKFLEREARNLGDHIIDGRLERGRRRPTRDVVLEFIEGIADRELRGDLRDRKSGRLRCERRRARNARVHLDDQDPSVLGIHRKLHVRAARVDADLAQHRDRGVAQTLILAVGQGLGRRHRDRVAGVNPHRVDVLDRAHDDANCRFGRAPPPSRTLSSRAPIPRAAPRWWATHRGRVRRWTRTPRGCRRCRRRCRPA